MKIKFLLIFACAAFSCAASADRAPQKSFLTFSAPSFSYQQVDFVNKSLVVPAITVSLGDAEIALLKTDYSHESLEKAERLKALFAFLETECKKIVDFKGKAANFVVAFDLVGTQTRFDAFFEVAPNGNELSLKTTLQGLQPQAPQELARLVRFIGVRAALLITDMQAKPLPKNKIRGFLAGAGTVALAAGLIFRNSGGSSCRDSFSSEPLSDYDVARFATGALRASGKRLLCANGSRAVDVSPLTDYINLRRGGRVSPEELLQRLANNLAEDFIPQEFRRCASAFDMQFAVTSNEDAIDFLHQGDWVALAVYDGHSARHTSHALAEVGGAQRLLPRLLALVQAHSLDQARVNGLYRAVDDELFERFNTMPPPDKGGGSTAIVCLLNRKENQGYFINLGDSRGVGIKTDANYFATNDQDPDAQEETKRIEAAGGRVEAAQHFSDRSIMPARVDGQLAVARSFGDFVCKPVDSVSGQRKYHIGIEPHIYPFSLTGVKTLVLGCDGVWDKVDSAEVDHVLVGAPGVGLSPAQHLCYTAGARESYDNISAVVFNLDEWI